MNVMKRKDNQIFRTHFLKLLSTFQIREVLCQNCFTLFTFFYNLLTRDFRASLLFIMQTNLNANNHQLKQC